MSGHVHAELVAPRLQLRWEQDESPGTFLCHYEIVLPLREFDIRREVYDEDGVQTGEVSELVIPILGPTRRTSNCVPCKSMRDEDETLYFDSPYRAGAHAKWDAAVLGGLPVYVIALDGTALTEPQP